MSNIYITEPPTSGKVLLKTTVGDIDIELWAKETPKTCRNFIQLCLEGYYDGTIFHRVVRGFIAQGGDPQGDGTGGDSIYGAPFKDEFHSRLRFNRRGLIAMANAGKDDNSSQFFFTLAPTPELQNKHTIFGKITGQTVFNMIKLEEGMIVDERPEYPHKIIKTEVLSNPFTDIEVREKVEEGNKEEKVKIKQPGVKNFKLLSFGEEAEEDEEENFKANTQFSGKSKSTHDLLDDPKLSSKSAINNHSSSEESETEENLQEQLESIRAKLRKEEKKKPLPTYLNKSVKEEKKRKAEEIREEIKKVKKEYQENKLEKQINEKKTLEEEEKKTETFKEYKEEYDKYKEKKQELPKKGKTREDFTLQLLNKFKSKLENARENKKDDEESNDEDEDTNWMAHKLKFQDDTPVLAKDANTKGDDWFEIYDPRNPINKRRREESKKMLSHSSKN